MKIGDLALVSGPRDSKDYIIRIQYVNKQSTHIGVECLEENRDYQTFTIVPSDIIALFDDCKNIEDVYRLHPEHYL